MSICIERGPTSWHIGGKKAVGQRFSMVQIVYGIASAFDRELDCLGKLSNSCMKVIEPWSVGTDVQSFIWGCGETS